MLGQKCSLAPVKSQTFRILWAVIALFCPSVSAAIAKFAGLLEISAHVCKIFFYKPGRTPAQIVGGVTLLFFDQQVKVGQSLGGQLQPQISCGAQSQSLGKTRVEF